MKFSLLIHKKVTFFRIYNCLCVCYNVGGEDWIFNIFSPILLSSEGFII